MDIFRAILRASLLLFAVVPSPVLAGIITVEFTGTFTTSYGNPYDPSSAHPVADPIHGTISFEQSSQPTFVSGSYYASYLNAITSYSVTSSSYMFSQYYGSTTVTGSTGTINIQGGGVPGILDIRLQPVGFSNLQLSAVFPSGTFANTTLPGAGLTSASLASPSDATIFAGIGCTQYVACGPATYGQVAFALTNTAPVTPPTAEVLGRLSNAVYGTTRPDNGTEVEATGYALVDSTDRELGFYGAEYRNGNQIVIALRGTNVGAFWNGEGNAGLAAVKDIVADASFVSGVPDAALESYVRKAAHLVATARDSCSACTITVTGHSLGGALADIIGKATGYNTVSFNAPGAGKLLSALSDEVSEAVPAGGPGQGTILDYRLAGDAISQFGDRVGTPITYGTSNASGPALVVQAFTKHRLSALVSAIQNDIIHDFGVGGPIIPASSISDILVAATCPTPTFCAFPKIIQNGSGILFDPIEGNKYTFAVDDGSPFISSLLLPDLEGVDHYRFGAFASGMWTELGNLSAETLFNFAGSTSQFWFSAYDAFGNLQAIPQGMIFQVTFASPGEVRATLNVEPTGVPEPSSWALMLLGFGAIGGVARRRPRTKALA